MIKGIVTQRSYHGLSYFHLNDVLVDVIPIVLTRHTVVDVILTQVVLTGGKTHKYDEQLCQNTTWTQRMDPLALPKKGSCVQFKLLWQLKGSEQFKPTRASSLSFMNPVWRVILVFHARGHSARCPQTTTELRYRVAFPFNVFILLWHPASQLTFN